MVLAVSTSDLGVLIVSAPVGAFTIAALRFWYGTLRSSVAAQISVVEKALVEMTAERDFWRDRALGKGVTDE